MRQSASVLLLHRGKACLGIYVWHIRHRWVRRSEQKAAYWNHWASNLTFSSAVAGAATLQRAHSVCFFYYIWLGSIETLHVAIYHRRMRSLVTRKHRANSTEAGNVFETRSFQAHTNGIRKKVGKQKTERKYIICWNNRAVPSNLSNRMRIFSATRKNGIDLRRFADGNVEPASKLIAVEENAEQINSKLASETLSETFL